jgi:hypothetical protein
VSAIAHAVGDPGKVNLAEQVEVRTPRRGLVDDPIGRAAEIVPAIDHRAEEIRILDDDRPAERDLRVLDRHLSARDRTMIGVVDRAAFRLGELAHELRHESRVVAARELGGESRLAGRF